MSRKIFAHVFFALLVLFSGCGNKGPKYKIRKKRDKVAYIIDESAINFAPLVENALNDTFYDPMPDAVFDVDGFTPAQFQLDAGYPFVFILTAPQLTSYAFFKIAFGDKGPGIYSKENVFSEGDFVIGVCAPGPELLEAFMKKYSTQVKRMLYNAYMKHLKKLVYFAGKNDWMKKEIVKKYGISLDVPAGWTYIKLKDTIMKFDDIFGITKHYPERFMFFYHRPDIRYFDEDLLIKIRDSIASLYYGGDKVVKSSVKTDSMQFLGKYNALVLTGAWQDPKEYVGGPFRTIAFISDRGFYMIDMGVYAPEKRRKVQYLLRMQIFASSMRFLSE